MYYNSNNRQCRFQCHLVNSDFKRVTIPTSFKFTTLQPTRSVLVTCESWCLCDDLINWIRGLKKKNTVLTNMSVHDFLSAKATHILDWFRKRKIQFVNYKKCYLSFPRKRDYIKCYTTINVNPQKGGREASYSRENWLGELFPGWGVWHLGSALWSGRLVLRKSGTQGWGIWLWLKWKNQIPLGLPLPPPTLGLNIDNWSYKM